MNNNFHSSGRIIIFRTRRNLIFRWFLLIAGSVKSALDTSEEEWNNIFRTNLTGAWLVSKSICARMRNAKMRGSIVNISSTAGLNRGHLPGSVAYSASKAALNALTKVLLLDCFMMCHHFLLLNDWPYIMLIAFKEMLLMLSYSNSKPSRLHFIWNGTS